MKTPADFIKQRMRNTCLAMGARLFLFGDIQRELEDFEYSLHVKPVQRHCRVPASYHEIGAEVEKWFSIYENIISNIPLDALAEILNISRKRMLTFFRSHLMMDFRSYKEKKKIDLAKKILLEDEFMPVSEIGEKLGFNDKSNFHRQFKKIAGCTPGQWRRTSGHPEMAAED